MENLTDKFFTWLIPALILLAIVYSLFKRIKNNSKPYHKTINALNKKERYASRIGDLKIIKQINLEKLWVENVAAEHIRSASFGRIYSINQKEADIDKHAVLSEISEAELKLPNISPYVNEYKKQAFLKEIITKLQDVIIESDYNGRHYMPESILPFPKDYLVFAIDYLLTKDQSKFMHEQYALMHKMLTKRFIDIDARLLPTDEEGNKRVGSAFKT